LAALAAALALAVERHLPVHIVVGQTFPLLLPPGKFRFDAGNNTIAA
jgi:hypothetical protein